MEGVQFEEDGPVSTAASRAVTSQQQKGRIGFVTKLTLSLGLAKDESQAQKVLLVFALVVIVAAIAYYFVEGRPHAATLLTPDQLNANLYHTNP